MYELCENGGKSKVKVKVKNILFQQDHIIVWKVRNFE